MLKVLFLKSFVESCTNPAFDLHALNVLLLWVLEDDVREVCPRYQTFNVV